MQPMPPSLTLKRRALTALLLLLMVLTGRVVGRGTTDAGGSATVTTAGLPSGVYVVRCGTQAQRLVVE